jgi:hypothetical protein
MGASIADGGINNLEVFRNTFSRLMRGFPIGAAMKYFNQRYTELSSELFIEIEGGQSDSKFAKLKVATIDARNYVIIGDPCERTSLISRDRKWLNE